MINERPHKKLILWKESMELVTLIYDVTKTFSKEEDFGLKGQLRRASVSVPSNISEGLTRRTTADKLHFLNIADASLSEIDTQIEIAFRLKYINTLNFDTVENKIVTVEKLLGGLIRSFK